MTRKAWCLDDVHPGEELVEVRGDDLLERDVAVRVTDADPSRERVGDLDPGEQIAFVDGIAHHDREVERQVGHVRERVPGIDRERGQHREDSVVEPLGQDRPFLVVELAPADQLDAFGPQPGDDRVDELLLLLADELADDVADDGELLARQAAVGGRLGHAGGGLVEQARDAHLEELVEVAREDRQEPHLFEQRHIGVAGELQHARVEREPAELAVEERRVVVIPTTHSGDDVGRRVGGGHACSRRSAAPTAPPVSPSRARTTGAV